MGTTLGLGLLGLGADSLKVLNVNIINFANLGLGLGPRLIRGEV